MNRGQSSDIFWPTLVGMNFTEVRPGIHTAILDPEQVTVTVIVGETCCLLVDTGSTPAQGAAIRRAVAELTDVPLRTVAATHGHWDHSFGLTAFADLDSIGSEHLPEDLRCRENTEWAVRQGFDLDTLALPTTSVSMIGVRDLGGLTVEIASFGPAHTRSDLILAVPDRSVVLVGDLVESGPPQFDETSSLVGWVKALDALHSVLKPTTIVIPGHGHPLTVADVAHFRSGLAALWDQSKWAFQQGVPVDKTYDQEGVEWPWDRTTACAGISLAYRELSAQGRGHRE